MHSSSALVRLGVGLVLGYGLLLAEGSPVNAEIRSEGKKGLFTKVNGKIDGSCGSGVCKISGGVSAGKNLFTGSGSLIRVERLRVLSSIQSAEKMSSSVLLLPRVHLLISQ